MTLHYTKSRLILKTVYAQLWVMELSFLDLLSSLEPFMHGDLLIVLAMVMTTASNWLVNMNCLVLPFKS
jgi:hypothetical protein